jgi:hypothetical protein
MPKDPGVKRVSIEPFKILAIIELGELSPKSLFNYT